MFESIATKKIKSTLTPILIEQNSVQVLVYVNNVWICLYEGRDRRDVIDVIDVIYGSDRGTVSS